jgi:hypothetical protein
MKLHRILTATLISAAVAMANPYQSPEEEIATVTETGKAAATTLLKTLGGNLKKQMKANGPVGAVKFCTENAYTLTESVSDSFGQNVSIKRISLKERNPSNVPEGKETIIMDSLQTLHDNGVVMPEYILERVDADTFKYYKPLQINKGVCLKCHGNYIDEKVAAEIKNMYPTDKATGYVQGDLRGAIVVTIKK